MTFRRRSLIQHWGNYFENFVVVLWFVKRSFASRTNVGLKHQASQSGRTSSIISNVSGGSVNEEFSDDEYEDDDDFDNIDGNFPHDILHIYSISSAHPDKIIIERHLTRTVPVGHFKGTPHFNFRFHLQRQIILKAYTISSLMYFLIHPISCYIWEGVSKFSQHCEILEIMNLVLNNTSCI